jgi:hypothetical protein
MTARATVQVGQFGRPTLSKDGRTITVRIPISLRHQGGRKQVVTPALREPCCWIASRMKEAANTQPSRVGALAAPAHPLSRQSHILECCNQRLLQLAIHAPDDVVGIFARHGGTVGTMFDQCSKDVADRQKTNGI